MAGKRGGDEGTRVLLVGVKQLDAQSKELLTWSMVKVANPGDRVIVVHVIGTNDIVDQDGKSLLFSVVREFDSVLAVYEGFCNLKQVELKLKICRGSSIRKTLVREARCCAASKLILGTATKHHIIRSSSSVAKHCARKLAKECSVLAVYNGNVVFEREASHPRPCMTKDLQGVNKQMGNGTLSKVNQNLCTDLKLIHIGRKGSCEELERALANVNLDRNGLTAKQNCGICIPHPTNIQPGKGDEKSVSTILGKDSMGIVPVEKPAESKDEALKRPGWPLLRKTLLSVIQEDSDPLSPRKTLLSIIQEDSDPSSPKNSSVVRSAVKLSSSNMDSTSNFLTNPETVAKEDDISDTQGESGAIVPFDAASFPAQREHSNVILPVVIEKLHEKYSLRCRLFKFEELQRATSDFAPEDLIGKGGSSRVYRGCLSDGKKLAVKILRSSEDVLRDFLQEIEIITSLHHKNIISLVGYCLEGNNMLLVYDLLQRGSLEENLHGSKKNPYIFGWNERYKVAIGVAEVINHLHNVQPRPVIHRDVKSSNILLSDDFEPRLSDFGLATWASSSSSVAFNDIAGTFGYLAPEYFMYGKVTEKIDVYAYGVVLLELLSGRRPISNDQPKGRESLVMWAKPMLNGGQIAPLLDPSLGSKYNLDQMERMVLTANLCIRRSPQARPKMSMVVKLIKGNAEAMKWARLQVNTTDNSDRLHHLYAEGFHPSPSSRITMQSHINLALLDVVEDDSLSTCSVIDQNVSLEDYLRGRWSRSSSFKL